ncbi:MAG: glycoside hydrolase family 9 protein [Fibrobacter sp.]|nr:glycoside hydrolase family 9 protein [Fibrobacter sp.]
MFWKGSLIGLLSVGSLAFSQAYINQIGYRTNDTKSLTLVGGNNSPIEFVNANGEVVLTANPSAQSEYKAAGISASLVDFTELKTPGIYKVRQGGNMLREDLKIGDKTYEDVLKASLKWYYFQRASMELTEQYAGEYKRAAGHMDTDVKMHNSTGGSGSISSPKGWYDAGDYGKYIVNSGITTYTLLALFEHYPEYFKQLKWNIPADGALPDLLAEIKYNLDWMLTMQAADGSVYHKVTALGFPGDIMPEKDKDARYVIGKGTAAAFDFAAVMAAAARVYGTFDATYAAKCLEAAKKAYAWGAQNPNQAYSNPMGVSTGEYGDKFLDDEKWFAATELYVTTKDASYKVNGATEEIPSWAGVGGIATYEKSINKADFGSEGYEKLIKTADTFASRAETGFGVVMAKEDFVWGSNAVAANQGVWLLHAYYVTGEEKYYKAAVRVLDYLLGKNPLDLSFVTGFGTKSPKKPHHRPSTADNIEAPVPGMLVGGPQPGGEDIGTEEWSCSDYRTGKAATSYIDNNCSYATNEVAINWNAPFAYLAGAIEAINAGHKPSFSVINPSWMGIAKVRGLVKQNSDTRLIFDGHKVMIKKGEQNFDLKGKMLK